MNTTLALNLTFADGVFADIMTHWTDQRVAPSLGTTSAIGSSDTSITLGAAVPLIPAGVTIVVVDASGSVEPMSVTSPVTNSATIPVTRSFSGITPASHASGATVWRLLYQDPMVKLAAEVLQPWVNNIVTTLAQQNRSAQIPPVTGSYTVSGS